MKRRVKTKLFVQSQSQFLKILLNVEILSTVWLYLVAVASSFPLETTSTKPSSPSLLELNIDRRRQILEPHHADEIISTATTATQGQTQRRAPGGSSSIETHRQSNIFEDYVKVVCSTSCIPRKELYEAWSSAVLIQKYFPHERRIADLACGHGLLSWSLLLLDVEMEQEQLHLKFSPPYSSPRTAVCIDQRMPKSAEQIAAAMVAQWPQLKDRWDYVESKLENIVMTTDADPVCDSPSSSSSPSKTLLCGVHACGVLSDQIISLALNEGCGYGQTSLALVPCCHAKKSLVDLSTYDHDDDDDIYHNNDNTKSDGHHNNPIADSSSSPSSLTSYSSLSLAEYIDSLRIKRLQSYGYNVTKDEIPREYTPQNSVILATPPPTPSTINHSYRLQMQQKQRPRQRIIQRPRLLQVPIGNDRKSIEIIKSLSGRRAAELRKLPPPPSLCVSMFMPKDNNEITPQCLLSVVDKIWNNGDSLASKSGSGKNIVDNQDNHDDNGLIRTSNIKVEIQYFDNGPYLHPNGLYARTFRITYNQENHKGISKERAKELHGQFCDGVQLYIEGLCVRR